LWRPVPLLVVKSHISAIQETEVALELGKNTLKPHQKATIIKSPLTPLVVVVILMHSRGL